MKDTLVAARAHAAQEGRADVSVIAFNDNSSAIVGGPATVLVPRDAEKADQGDDSSECGPCALVETRRTLHSLLTAETHNFPCAVAPFPGAETGALSRVLSTGLLSRFAFLEVLTRITREGSFP